MLGRSLGGAAREFSVKYLDAVRAGNVVASFAVLDGVHGLAARVLLRRVQPWVRGLRFIPEAHVAVGTLPDEKIARARDTLHLRVCICAHERRFNNVVDSTVEPRLVVEHDIDRLDDRIFVVLATRPSSAELGHKIVNGQDHAKLVEMLGDHTKRRVDICARARQYMDMYERRRRRRIKAPCTRQRGNAQKRAIKQSHLRGYAPASSC